MDHLSLMQAAVGKDSTGRLQQLQPSSTRVGQQAKSAPSFKLTYINAAVLDGTITSYRFMPSFPLTDFNVTGRLFTKVFGLKCCDSSRVRLTSNNCWSEFNAPVTTVGLVLIPGGGLL